LSKFDSEMEKIAEETQAHDRAGTLTAATMQELKERMDRLLAEEAPPVLQPREEGSGSVGSVALALAYLSPAILVIVFILLGVIVPWSEGMAPLMGLAGMQAMLLYAALRPIDLSRRPGPGRTSPEIERRKREIEASFMEGLRRRRQVVRRCAALVFAVLALVIMFQ
jgi:hypothetical protein